jgi:tripartite-type tricarboxylate transporter receptor subunit TctC
MVKGCGYCSVVLLSVLISMMFAGMFAGAIPEANSQERYPTRAIEIICPYNPGASTDLVNRITAQYLNRKWGVPVNVVNKPGGNTVPACLEVYNATPDGYTLFGDSLPATSQLPVVVKNLPFKIMDRTFINMVALTPMVVIVPSTSPFKSMKEIEAEARKDPGNLTWTCLGGSAAIDFVLRQVLKAWDVDILKTKPIMCQGGSQAAMLTAGGHVKLGGGTVSGVLSAIKSGTVRPLAVTSKQRWPDLPDVPTTEEVGYPSVNVQNRLGYSGPPKLPSSIVEAWEKASQEMIKDPEVISKLKNIGAISYYLSARETRELTAKEIEEVEILFRVK